MTLKDEISKDNLFNILQDKTIVIDLELESITNQIDIDDINNTIALNDWQNSRTKEANKARLVQENRYKKLHSLENVILTIAKNHKLKRNANDNYFNDYEIILTIRKKI